MKLPKPGPKDKKSYFLFGATLPQNTGLEPEKEKYHVNGDTKRERQAMMETEDEKGVKEGARGSLSDY